MTVRDSNAESDVALEAMALTVWHGWRLWLPKEWSPVKLEGNERRGMALFADLRLPRLGLQWETPRDRRFDAAAWAARAMNDEVGQLSAALARPVEELADRWQSPLLFVEPEPPGRDVFVAASRASGRAILVTHPLRERDTDFAETIMPRIQDDSDGQTADWSIFDLSCRVPTNMRLVAHRFHAGDLWLTFASPKRRLTVRQVAVASMALKRFTLEQWLTQQQSLQSRYFRPNETTDDLQIAAAGRPLRGMQRTMSRRRRFFFARWLPSCLITYVLHDEQRDRLVFLEGDDPAAMRDAAASLGWAQQPADG